MLQVPIKGQCQCGQCAYTVTSPPFVSYTCHCSACQKLSGSAFMTCSQVPSESVLVTGGNPKTNERPADSGNIVKTWVCPDCGSPLFAQNAARPRIRTIYVGSLDSPEAIEVSAYIWTKRELPWVTLPKAHRLFEGAGDWTEDYINDISHTSRTARLTSITLKHTAEDAAL